MIPYGEGWPFPKLDARRGTVYRLYDNPMGDTMLVVATDEDGTRRGVEVSNEVWCSVIRPRSRHPDAESGVSLSGNEDFETLLQATEAWTTAAPPIDQEVLARALFETDPEVEAFLKRVDDSEAPVMNVTDWAALGLTISNRYGRALRIAWERDEHGWATRARHRAGQVDYASVLRAWEGFGATQSECKAQT